ncbi:TPA: DUF2235 domain-containing protein [Klebsiella pneumoniae]
MSEITETHTAWVPPPFPPQGRLPGRALQVGQNCHQQNSDERRYHQELCLAAGRRVETPCCKTLHISLFFDGTGNNLNHDFFIAKPKHPTNIARLFRATIGTGTAGGVPSDDQSKLFDDDAEGDGKYFKFYMPGVGTPFPEVNDPDYSTMGLVGAVKGEDRINWALLRIIDVLMFSATEKWLTTTESRRSLKEMSTSWNRLWFGGSHNRYEEFTRLLNDLASDLKPLIIQPEPGKPKLTGIKLYVYGFSRGAAAARTFVRWLSELLPPPAAEGEKPPQCLQTGGMQLPVSVEFLGLLDTVASVGVAHVVPVADGHMSWADGTMELPDDETYGGLIKKIANQPPDRMDELVLQPGVKDFDPKMDQTQLFDAAKEFGKDYHDGYRIPDNLAQLVLDTVLQPVIFILNTDDEAQEYRRMKRDGEARVAVLFPDAGEASNAEQPAGLVRALFDDQVHDSRAWFMYAALGTREMWTGYFRYRMIYFSERCSKPLSPLVLAGDLVGFATVTAGVVLSFRQKRLTGKLAGLAATGAVRSLEVAVLDQITGEALPELPGGEQLRAFTHEPGTVVAQQKARKADEQLARGQAALPASWLEDVLTTTV